MDNIENFEELQKEHHLYLIRRERDLLLKDSDWRMTDDYPYEDKELWRAYRQSLRELPNKIILGEIPRPTLNEVGNMIFTSWPEPPAT